MRSFKTKNFYGKIALKTVCLIKAYIFTGSLIACLEYSSRITSSKIAYGCNGVNELVYSSHELPSSCLVFLDFHKAFDRMACVEND